MSAGPPASAAAPPARAATPPTRALASASPAAQRVAPRSPSVRPWPRLRLERRAAPSPAMRLAAPLVAAMLTLLAGTVVFVLLGHAPLAALHGYFVVPLADANGVAELLLKAAPLTLIALGLAIGFRANVWNIGAEGQLVLGAIAGGTLAVVFDGSESALLLPAMALAGALAGGLWAAIPAWLRTRFNANEILVSLMLSYVAWLLLSYLVYGPLRDPAGLNFPQSILFGESALWPIIWDGTRLNASIFVALGAVPLGWVFLARSFAGYQLRVGGLAPDAARYAGFATGRAVWVGMLAGGIAAGLAGVGEVAGPLGQLQPVVSPGYGFAAIIVAFLGRLHPLGIVLASLLMSLLYLGGESAQITMQLPNAISGMFQGLLLFFLLGADVLVGHRVRVAR